MVAIRCGLGIRCYGAWRPGEIDRDAIWTGVGGITAAAHRRTSVPRKSIERTSVSHLHRDGGRPGLGHRIVRRCLIDALVTRGVIEFPERSTPSTRAIFVVPKTPGTVLPLHGLPRGTLANLAICPSGPNGFVCTSPPRCVMSRVDSLVNFDDGLVGVVVLVCLARVV